MSKWQVTWQITSDNIVQSKASWEVLHLPTSLHCFALNSIIAGDLLCDLSFWHGCRANGPMLWATFKYYFLKWYYVHCIPLTGPDVQTCRLTSIKYIKHKRVFHQISKHREKSWKYEAQWSIVDKLRCVWKSYETLSRVFDISSQLKLNYVENRDMKSWKFMLIKNMFPNTVTLLIFFILT